MRWPRSPAVDLWAAAWSRKDVKAYLGAYARDFKTPAGETRASLGRRAAKRINKPGAIQVSVREPARHDRWRHRDGQVPPALQVRQRSRPRATRCCSWASVTASGRSCRSGSVADERPLRPLSLVRGLQPPACGGRGRSRRQGAQASGEGRPAAAVEARYTDSGPEPLLAKVFDAIENNRLDLAMQQTEMLIKAYPNFRLAHLVVGDLLLARSRPLTAFGEGGGPGRRRKGRRPARRGHRPPQGLPHQTTGRLRAALPAADAPGAEARHRGRYPEVAPLPLPERQGHAALRRRLLHLAGQARFRKVREGDKKTPIGVYHVTSSLPRQKLTDFYGSGAFPINYPNEWDKRQGRNGHGIWLHGTPSDTFSRPPKASDGCVVLANQDLDSLAKSLQVGLTPVIISNSIEWLSLDDWQSERSSLLKMIEEWRQ
jgi:hypothetical protein